METYVSNDSISITASIPACHAGDRVSIDSVSGRLDAKYSGISNYFLSDLFIRSIVHPFMHEESNATAAIANLAGLI